MDWVSRFLFHSLIPMEGPLRRLCVLRDDTLVQYAACLLAFLFWGEWWHNSIPITLARKVLQY